MGEAEEGGPEADLLGMRAACAGQQNPAITNEQGDYSFPGLRAGDYSVESEKQGFRTAGTANLEPRTGDHLRNDIALETGSVTDKVTVEATAPLLETDTSERGEVVQGAQVRELPLNKRDYTQLVLLTQARLITRTSG